MHIILTNIENKVEIITYPNIRVQNLNINT